MKISAVVNTLNAQNDIARCLESLKWADEIVVVDNVSTDATVDIAKGFTDQVFVYETQHGYVEPVRNFAIEQATGDWVLIVDADEEIPSSLAEKLRALVDTDESFYELPRKNIMFGEWFNGSGWWPDYNIRFFKKGAVTWTDKIHRPPETKGNGDKLAAEESLAIIHHHYESIEQFISRLHRYTTIQAKELVDEGYQFHWPDLLHKPLSEFLTRFFVWQGYKSGVHGLALSLLQATSFLVVYLKVWEKQGFQKYNSDRFVSEVGSETKQMAQELSFWQQKVSGQSGLRKHVKKLLGK